MLETRIDQIELLKNLLIDSNDSNRLSILYSAWASVYTTGSEFLKKSVLSIVAEPSTMQKRDIEFAVARMGGNEPLFYRSSVCEY